ncbi:hypothetical protein H072_7310 [Dactylellina haptotyla CBS 200.50]|uniref:Calcineurin-like phosphoesterase domain-containing protein n=1 Tax=Dactylellina haptotyla (strain CBS 200.50) TaxID=1284197 RepID=S8BUD6_DACHA|nr:hypothetical protein H072_7310 [Dactylellina haptotyla CBS 200.50]
MPPTRQPPGKETSRLDMLTRNMRSLNTGDNERGSSSTHRTSCRRGLSDELDIDTISRDLERLRESIRQMRHNSTSNSQSTTSERKCRARRESEAATSCPRHHRSRIPSHSGSPSATVKTTFMLVSDTHNIQPQKAHHQDGPFRTPFPKTDVFIHAGDMTQHGSLHALKRVIRWVSEVPAELKILIAGNHDCKLDEKYYVSTASDTDEEEENREESKECRGYLTSEALKAQGIYYLEDEIREFELNNGAKFTVLSSPYTPRGPPPHNKGSFRYNSREGYWFDKFPEESLPERVHVAVTHGPIHRVLDEVSSGEGGVRAGCKDLGKFMAFIRPLLSVCGHIHEAGGVRMLKWKYVDGGRGMHGLEVDMDEELEEVERGGALYKDARKISTAVVDGENTLFVNASIVGHGSNSYDAAARCPYVVELQLPRGTVSKQKDTGSQRRLLL